MNKRTQSDRSVVGLTVIARDVRNTVLRAATLRLLSLPRRVLSGASGDRDAFALHRR